MTEPQGPRLLGLFAKAAALAAIAALSAWAQSAAPAEVRYAGPVAAVGLLLLGGDLLAELVERVRLPHLTGYLAAGILLGPHVLGTVSAPTVQQLSLVNDLALALIALSAGAELTLALLREGARSLTWATLTQTLIALPLAAAGFFVLRPWLPFLDGLELPGAVGVSLLWGVLAVSKSPAATLGLIAQLRPAGPVTRYALVVVIAFDIVVLLLFAVLVQVVRGLVEPGAALDLAALKSVGLELAGAVAVGTSLGLLVTVYLALVGRQLLLALLVLAYGMTEFCAYFHFDALLLFVTAGFVVANLSPDGGRRLLETVSQGGRVAYVLFFAVAGADLDLSLLASVWPVAVALSLTRGVATWLAARAGSRWADDPEPVRRHGWASLISQAGVTIGLAVIVGEAYPETFGPPLRAMAIAVVGINEIVGPVLFKLALDSAGETGKADEKAEPSPSLPEERPTS